MTETAFDALRQGISLREARKEWVENSAGGMACGISEAQAMANERDELRRAQDFMDRVKQHYGREVSIHAARAAVRGRQLDGLFADLCAPEGTPNTLVGTTQEVIEQLRRGHPEWRITWAPEQPQQQPMFGGIVYGPGSMDAVGNADMAQNIIDRQRLSRTIG
jgi:hypothetical protein